MKLSKFQIISLSLGLFTAVSLLGGSAIWQLIGLGSSLNIDGHASIVRALPEAASDRWIAYGGDSAGTRYSSASEISIDNVDQLKPIWTYRTGAFNNREKVRHLASFQATPLMVEDALIFCTPFNEVISLDPETGVEKWRFDPQVPLDSNPANEFSCRGVSYWVDEASEPGSSCQSRVFMGTVEAKLIALDARTGELCAGFGTKGTVQIEPSMSLRWPGEFQITSAPAIAGDVVITGTAISDNLRSDAPIGTVHAFSARTGKLLWTFNPIPWGQTQTSTKIGHANVWSTMAVDTKRDMVFLPTSTASPDYYGGERPGNNEHANSVVALDAKTGTLLWARQLVHHDVWDYDLPAQPGLYEIWREGVGHDVVVQVTKMGLVFVLDRDTGEPFHPIEERTVPQAGVAGEQLSPTQPFPTVPPPIVPNSLNPDDAFGVTIWDKYLCEKKLRALRQDGLYTPPTLEGTLAYPFSGGGANWGGGAFDPQRNLLVINMNNLAAEVHLYPEAGNSEALSKLDHDAELAPMEGAPYSMSRQIVFSPLGLPCTPPPWGVIAGIDLNSGEIVWRKTLGTTQDIAPGGIALNFGTPSFGGPIVSSGGLIFIAATMDNYLRALNVETGEELWKGRLPAGGQATPMTYVSKGRQYVVIAAGGHGKSDTKSGDFIVAFALGGE
ncbi:MAG: pyrroloquinoline quinone-dependent dehydrogenase [Halioglobus sp.]